MLEQGISTKKKGNFLSAKSFSGYSITGNEIYFGGGCTAFSVMTPKGK